MGSRSWGTEDQVVVGVVGVGVKGQGAVVVRFLAEVEAGRWWSVGRRQSLANGVGSHSGGQGWQGGVGHVGSGLP